MPSVSITWLLEVPAPVLPDPPPTIPEKDNYTSEEISTSVGKLVQGAIRRPYGILGERNTLDTFDDTMDAAAGVFILTPSAPFYVILLGSRRLNDDVDSTISTAVDLLSAVESTGRRVKPLKNLTSLGNARTALAALEVASSKRSNSFESIDSTPAFQRFDKNTDRFLDDAAASIRVNEEIVETPQQARKNLGNLVSSITEAFQDIQRRVRLLYAGIDNYNSLNLPSLLAQGVIGKARSTLDERIEQLETLTPTERLEFLRETTLDVLVGKAVVKGFGSLPKSGEFVPIDGGGSLFADAAHPGNKAVVPSVLMDPYIILPGSDSLTFTLDGGPSSVTIPVQQSFIARIEGAIPEPYVITGGENDKLVFSISGFSDMPVSLTAGTRTAQQIVANMNSAVGSRPVIAETFLAQEKFFGLVTSTNSTGSTVDFVKNADPWSLFNVAIGDGVIVQTGAMTQLYLLISSVSGNTISCTVSGPGVTINAANITISVGVVGRFVRLRITDAGREAALIASRSITVKADVVDTAALTLGMFEGSSSQCRKSQAEEIVLSINSSPAATVANKARVEAEAVFAGGDILKGRSDPSNPSKLISTIYRAEANCSVGGTNVTFLVSGAQTAGVVVGNKVTIRNATDPLMLGKHGVITSRSDTQIVATMNSSVTAGPDYDIEFGLNLQAQKDQIFKILDPSFNAGNYRVASVSPNGMEALLVRPLPIYFAIGGQPVTFDMQLGALRVDFKSTSTLTNSQLSVDGTAANRFFTNPPATAVGSTPYVLFDKDPKVIEVGDRLEIYTGQYNEPQVSFGIIGFELGKRLIEVDVPIDNSFIDLDFSSTIEVPFARVRKLYRNNYDFFHTQLGLWLEQSFNSTLFFRDLNRFLNPLIVNENPTVSAVNTAKTQVQSLIQGMQQLQVILSLYNVEVVPQVDTLVDSFLSRGSDRAVDTLLEARFSDFFGYNSEEMSYLGNALERMRDVSRLDLPVRKTARKEVIDQELVLGEYEDPDFEFDQSDIQDNGEPDLPGSFIDIPGSNF